MLARQWRGDPRSKRRAGEISGFVQNISGKLSVCTKLFGIDLVNGPRIAVGFEFRKLTFYSAIDKDVHSKHNTDYRLVTVTYDPYCFQSSVRLSMAAVLRRCGFPPCYWVV
jgi:hypothetical protein